MEDAKNRAWAFLIKLYEETEKRLPSNLAVFQQHQFFSPSVVLSTKQRRFGEMPFIDCVDSEDIDQLEEQWRQVCQVRYLFGPTKSITFFKGLSLKFVLTGI